jgi:hypothetical protein
MGPMSGFPHEQANPTLAVKQWPGDRTTPPLEKTREIVSQKLTADFGEDIMSPYRHTSHEDGTILCGRRSN